MLKHMIDMPAGVIGIEATGTVTLEDYQKVFEPLLATHSAKGERIRLLYWFGPKFESFSAGAAWDDLKLGTKYLNLFERVAVVTDVGWIRHSTAFVGSFLPCPIRVFPNAELPSASQWLTESAPKEGLSLKFLDAEKVLLIEPSGSLAREDFEAVATRVDAWMKVHGELRGLVVHAKQFPGWENFGSFVRHIQFVQAHHTKIRHVALVTDSTLLKAAKMVGNHFVSAEVKHFPYEQLTQAIRWARGPVEEYAMHA